MMKTRIATVLLGLLSVALALPARAAAEEGELVLPCGHFVNLELKDDVALDWDVRKFGPVPQTDKDQTFAVLTVSVEAGKRIGKYDYSLNGAKCLAISRSETSFNPETWELAESPSRSTAYLLYLVDPANDRRGYTLNYKYSEEIDLPNEVVSLVVSTSTGRPAIPQATTVQGDDDDADRGGDDDDDADRGDGGDEDDDDADRGDDDDDDDDDDDADRGDDDDDDDAARGGDDDDDDDAARGGDDDDDAARGGDDDDDDDDSSDLRNDPFNVF